MGTTLKKTIFFFFLLAFTSLNAQLNNFKKWTIREGLAQSDVYAIEQDHKGYLWIGTAAGLSVFDGKTFINYSKRDGLCGNIVRAIYQDKKKRVWIGTENGVSVYDGGKFTKLNHDSGFKGNTATCITELNDKIFVGTDDGGITVISDVVGGKYKIDILNAENGLSEAAVLSIKSDLKGNLWAATYGSGINVIKFKNNVPVIEVIKGINKIPSDNLCSIGSDEEGNMWVGTTDAGAFKFNSNQFLQGDYSFQLLDEKSGLTSKSIWNILITKNKEVWFGSLDNGTYRLNANNKIEQYTDKEGLNGNQVLCLFQDKNQKVWIGFQGEGLALLQGDYFSHYNKSTGLADNKVQAIAKDNNEIYWLATAEGGLVSMDFGSGKPIFKTYDETAGMPTKALTSLAVGNKYNVNLWIGTSSNGIVSYDGKTFKNFTETDGLANNSVYSICVDQKGIVWCGTANGISRYDGSRFLNVSTEKMLMENEGVKSVVCDKNENVWFATAGGLARYNGSKKLRTFDEVEGLKTKDVNALAIDKIGNVWIGTNGGGIYKFDISKDDKTAISLQIDETRLSSGIIKSMLFVNDSVLLAGTFKGFDKIIFANDGTVRIVQNYNANDGFIGQECNENALFMDNEKNVWFGTVKGLTKYSPALERRENFAPALQIMAVQLFFKPIDWKERGQIVMSWFNNPDKGNFNYKENHFTFKFNASSLSNPEKLLYSYILEGKDKEWSPLKQNSEVTYSGLEPGKYIFKVKAIDVSNLFSEPQVFSFEITPPWYRTKLFYIIAFLLITLAIIGYIKWREKKLIKEKETLERIVDEKTHEVRVQKEEIAEKHKEITDSINYAERIQRAMLASKMLLDNHALKLSGTDKNAGDNYFILFKPKDVVSGDFYWASELSDGRFCFVTADSTGHGVPGAIMSMLNMNSLKEGVTKGLVEPDAILNYAREIVINTLANDGTEEGGKDGMDCSLMVFDYKNLALHWVAANNPILVVRNAQESNAELIELKPQKMPVGRHDRQDEPFVKQVLQLQKGDIIYTITDGYPDQFGGDPERKFFSKNLKEFLRKNAHLPMIEQQDLLYKTFIDWMGPIEQTDDVTVIGIKV